MWVEMLLAGLFYMALGIIAVLLGVLARLICVYFATALMMMAQGHLLWQIYELYLQRGGTPVPLKPVDPPKPPVATAM
jgi:hypothetical protein